MIIELLLNVWSRSNIAMNVPILNLAMAIKFIYSVSNLNRTSFKIGKRGCDYRGSVII